MKRNKDLLNKGQFKNKDDRKFCKKFRRMILKIQKS